MRWKPGVCVIAACVLAGCASPSHRAPVEDRATSTRRAPNAGATGGANPAWALPGAENAGKPGYYTVKPGDTLIRVGLDSGQNWRDIVRWNNLENPNVIEVGQVLRVVPPASEAGVTVASVRPVVPSRVETRPLDGRPANPASVVPVAPAAASGPAAASAPTVQATKPPPVQTVASKSDEELTWAWPASGSVVSSFDEARNKGLGIAGKTGDAVLAAADGRVVYAGSGLRGYGNLVIVKHNSTFLTAYAHNHTLLVKEDQAVQRGQKIAEMGSTDAERVKLHFEIRRQGKPVDPAKYLPAR